MSQHLYISETVAVALKRTSVELEAMTIGRFLLLAYDNGYDVRFNDRGVLSTGKGRLLVTMDQEKRPILHADGVL